MTIIISPAQAGITLKTLLRRELRVSNTLLGRLKRRPGALLRNGERVFVTAVLAAGDVVTVDLADPPRAEGPAPVPLPLDVVYEDEALLILNKSAPLAVQPSSFAPEEPTLANALAARWGTAATFHPVNRLDRGTTGLMAVARSRYVHNLLRQQLHTPDFYREYRGIAVGRVSPDRGVIDRPIARAEGSPIKRRIDPAGQPARTEYAVLAFRAGLTLLRLVPRTGRTHQLRLHMANAGFPLLGDWLYGTEDRAAIPRPALHAAILRLRHPLSGEALAWEAPLPPDMARFFPEAGGQPEA